MVDALYEVLDPVVAAEDLPVIELADDIDEAV